MDLTHLGTPTGPPVRVSGGTANRTYRLDTDRGSFAVKELDLTGRRWASPVDDVVRLERAAFAAGLPLPEPVAHDDRTVVHRWVEGDPVPEAPAPAALASAVGEVLARLHALDVGWPPAPARDPAPHDWPRLAERAAATGQPWADELAARVPTLHTVARFLDTCERPGPVVLTHRDVQPWNLLARAGRPVLLDWELAGWLDLSGELGATALGLAKGPGLDDVDPASFRAVLDGYAAGGGIMPPAGPSWFAFLLDGWLGHVHWHLLRALAGAAASTGPDLAVSHAVVRDGLPGLPLLFERLPALEELLLR